MNSISHYHLRRHLLRFAQWTGWNTAPRRQKTRMAHLEEPAASHGEHRLCGTCTTTGSKTQDSSADDVSEMFSRGRCYRHHHEKASFQTVLPCFLQRSPTALSRDLRNKAELLGNGSRDSAVQWEEREVLNTDRLMSSPSSVAA